MQPEDQDNEEAEGEAEGGPGDLFHSQEVPERRQWEVEMKLEAFMKMATKLKEQKPAYASCICSSTTYELIKSKFEVYDEKFIGINIFKENYFPDDTAWLLDEDYTDIYLKDGLAGLINQMAKEITLKREASND